MFWLYRTALATLNFLKLADTVPIFFPLDLLWPFHKPGAVWTQTNESGTILAVADKRGAIPFMHSHDKLLYL